jgi:hypothetical protein
MVGGNTSSRPEPRERDANVEDTMWRVRVVDVSVGHVARIAMEVTMETHRDASERVVAPCFTRHTLFLDSENSNSVFSGLPLYQLSIVHLGSINTVQQTLSKIHNFSPSFHNISFKVEVSQCIQHNPCSNKYTRLVIPMVSCFTRSNQILIVNSQPCPRISPR